MRKTNKMKKILLIVMLMVILVSITTGAFAKTVSIDSIKDDNPDVGGSTEMKKIGSIILSGITGVGMALAVIIVAILGVKYMLGSADERAEYKKSMLPYLIGALLVFGASAIAGAVTGLVK